MERQPDFVSSTVITHDLSKSKNEQLLRQLERVHGSSKIDLFSQNASVSKTREFAMVSFNADLNNLILRS